MIPSQIKQPFRDVFHLFYPNLCLACGQHLKVRKDIICISCQVKLPKTNFHLHEDNPVIEHFWGRISIGAGAAYLYFSKGSKAQQLLHELKYKGKGRIGVVLGKRYGMQLKKSPLYQSIDLIVPVPIHIRKRRIRGYNQSAKFAEGLSETLGVPWKEGMKRLDMVDSQTQKSRMARFENVENSFQVLDPKSLADKHILLVDDVITTGATLEACALKILAIPGTKVSVATIAIAR